MTDNIRNALIFGLDADEYHNGGIENEISNTMLTHMAKSPRHCYALHYADERPRQFSTPAMFAGTLAHCMILEPHTVLNRYAVKPENYDGRTVAGKTWLASLAPNMKIVSEQQLQTAHAQRNAVLAVPELAHLFSSGHAEVSVFWRDEKTGQHCRCRPDWIHTRSNGHVICIDLKTAVDVSPDGFAKSIATYGYHRQLAHYVAGLDANGIIVDEFVFAAVSNAYPFIAVPYVLDIEASLQGWEEVAELLALHAECMKTGIWPAYGSGRQYISLPKWASRSNEIEVRDE
jgi:exodeoxyribonuclease VIII